MQNVEDINYRNGENLLNWFAIIAEKHLNDIGQMLIKIRVKLFAAKNAKTNL